MLSFGRLGGGGAPEAEQVLLRLVSSYGDSDDAAAEIVDNLAEVDASDWSQRFGYRV